MCEALTRRELCISLSALALDPLRVGAQALKQPSKSLLPVAVNTLNHMTFSAPNLGATVRWYQRVLGMPIMYNQHFNGRAGGLPILRIGKGSEYIALSSAQGGPPLAPPFTRVRPHFCWGVKNFDADRLLRALSDMNVPGTRSRFREGNVLETNFEDPDGFPLQFIDVTGCGGGGYLANICDMNAVAFREPGDPPPIPISTLNHVAYTVPNIKRSLAWYQKLTDVQVVHYQEPEGGPRTEGYVGPPAPVLRVGTGPHHLVFFEGPGTLSYRAHIGLGVEGFKLEALKKRLDEHGVKWRVRMREGVTPELLLDAPDYIEIQLVDVSYNGGGGPLGNVLRSPRNTSV